MSTSFETPLNIEHEQQAAETVERSRLREAVQSGGKIAGRVALVVGLATGMAATEAAVAPYPAVAATGGYPDADAALRDAATYTWWKDENGNSSFNTGEDISSRGYAYRNCTDWAAFRASQVAGSVPWGLGNAKNWDNAAPSGWIVDTTPEPGDIAQSEAGTYGHVGTVEGIYKNEAGAIAKIDVSEYNKAGTGVYTILPYYPDANGIFWRDGAHTKKWDHFLDLNGTGKGINGEDLNGGGGTTTTLNAYGPKAVTVTPNVLGGLSVFTAADSGLMAYKDQAYAGQDLATKSWGTITEHTIGQPEVVTTPSGAMAVFAHGANDHLYHAWQTSAGSAWSGDISPWNVSLRGDPVATFNYTGGMSVFFPDSNGNMREIDQIGSGGDMGSAPVNNLGGNLQGKPSVMNIDGKLVLFAHGADGGLYTDYQSAVGGTWSGWELLGGQDIQGDPAVVINRLGGMTVTAVGESGELVGIDQTYKGESMNKPFYSLGKPSGVNLAGTPAVLQTTNGEEMVFAESTDGAVYHKAQVQSNSYNWSGYYPLGGDLTSKPTVVRNSAGGASIFGRAENGDVVTLDQPSYGASFNANWIDLGKG